MDGSPALQFWECVLGTLSSKPAKGNLERHTREEFFRLIHILTIVLLVWSIDHVPPSIANSSHAQSR